MITLILAVASSSIIFVIFKLFNRYGIDVFQAIVFNYFTAFLIGIGLYGQEWDAAALNTTDWIGYVLLSAVLFISLFLLMGNSSQRNGVALTSTAVKMSMAMSMLLMILLYNEPVSFLKIAGIMLAFAGVFLVSFTRGTSSTEKGAHWMLLVLFFGSGILDFVLNYVQKNALGALTPSLFSAFGLGAAGVLGSVVLCIELIRRRAVFRWKNVFAGLILGIPNYFSIYLLISAYRDTGWTDSTVLAVNNVSVVILAALIGFILFKESTGWQKLLGLLLSVAAILFMYVSSLS